MKSKKGTKLKEWQDLCKSGARVCEKCGESRFLTVDHIVPCYLLEHFTLDRLYLLQDMEENFQILCKWCNLEKNSRIDPRNPKTYTVLRHVLDLSEKEVFELSTVSPINPSENNVT